MKQTPSAPFRTERLKTPVGDAFVVTDEAGALRAFDWTDNRQRLERLLDRYYQDYALVDAAGESRARERLAAYFDGEISAIDAVEFTLAGTPFQQRVWRGLVEIPAGETLSYGGLAKRLGSPGAMRAVGLANGSNIIAVVVPCHRVIGADGRLTGYGSGVERKRWLLNHEGAAFRDEPSSVRAQGELAL